MEPAPFIVSPESFIRAVDYVVHDYSVQLAHFYLTEDKPVGSLTKEPLYTLCGTEKGANLSAMFDLAKTGKSSMDGEIKNILYLSEGWNRQLIPADAFDTLRLVVETNVRLQELDEEISDWEMAYHVSPKSEPDYATNRLLQLAQKQEDSMELRRKTTLARLRYLEQKIVTEYGFDLDRYPTIKYGALGDSTPYKMDHVMNEAIVHAIEYYFNPTELNKMVFNTLKPLHDKQIKKLVDIVNTFNAICERRPINV
jgi:hypothetical protein